VQGTQSATFIAGISGTGVTGTTVVVNSSGQLGVALSSERFKDAIEPMGNSSEALLSLRPVTFHYKKNIDPKCIPQFGLVAEEVEKVNPDLVVRDAEGKVFTVRYEAVNAMLLNEFLREHKKVEEQNQAIAQLKSTVTKQEATISQQQNQLHSIDMQQQKEIQALTTRLKGQEAQIHKVSDRVELKHPAPQVVDNSQ